MNWGAVGAVAELLAALGVLLSLLYVGSQIRQNTRVARSVARQGIAQAAMAGAASLAENGDLAELFHRSLAGTPLAPHEVFRLQAYCYLILRQYENIHFQFVDQMLPDHEWAGFRTNLELFFRTDVFNQYWEQDQSLFSPRFVALVDAVRSELEASGVLGTAGRTVVMGHEREPEDADQPD